MSKKYTFGKVESATGTTNSSWSNGTTSGTASTYSHTGSSNQTKQKTYAKCYESHPPLKLLNGTFIGGSCSNPVCLTADVYIGFDFGMKLVPSFPWEDFFPVQISFEIQDMGVPKNVADFKSLVTWTAQQLQDGKTVHAGCIGGHGRTGMFLSALYKEVTGDADAITTVRSLYCKKAVESTAQMQFLALHYGITAVAPAKESNHSTYQAPKSKYDNWPKSTGGAEFKSKPKLSGSPFAKAEQEWPCLKGSPLAIVGSIF